MKVFVAKDAGYCFGVRDAVNLAYETAEEYGTVYMLGDIVHNENVVKNLNKTGTKVVQSLNEIPENDPVLFRAHGTATQVWQNAKDKNMNIIDATCPLVREIHDEVSKLEKEGRRIIIIGVHGHDEVVGIASQVKDPIIIENPEEALNLRKMKKAGIVSQSTQTIENVQDIINILMTKVFDLRFVNTICFPTKRNQNQIKELENFLSEECLDFIADLHQLFNSKRLHLLEERKKIQKKIDNGWLPDFLEKTKQIRESAWTILSTPDDLLDLSLIHI